MANLKASKKDILRNRRNRLRNVHFMSVLKTSIKKAVAAIETNAENSETLLKLALKQIDKTASKGIIHANSASRKKSKLVKFANKSNSKKDTPNTEKTTKEVKAKKTTTKAKATPKKEVKTTAKKTTTKAKTTQKTKTSSKK